MIILIGLKEILLENRFSETLAHRICSEEDGKEGKTTGGRKSVDSSRSILCPEIFRWENLGSWNKFYGVTNGEVTIFKAGNRSRNIGIGSNFWNPTWEKRAAPLNRLSRVTNRWSISFQIRHFLR